jgi:hypothetical protein
MSPRKLGGINFNLFRGLPKKDINWEKVRQEELAMELEQQALETVGNHDIETPE